jgi:hypothetical protein
MEPFQVSNIPLARVILASIKKDFLLRPAITRRLNKALGHLNRRKSIQRVRGTRARCTPALRAKIKAWHASHPRWTLQRIAERYNVTNARVSYTLRGENK